MKKIMPNNLKWEVLTNPVSINGVNYNSKKALLRSDTGELIGIRSKHYHPVFNKDLNLLKNKLIQNNLFEFKGFSELQNGKKILGYFKCSENLNIINQPVRDYLIIGNTHDATSKLFIGSSNYMIRCKNQFSEKIRNIEWRHDKPFDLSKINIDELIHSYLIGRQKIHREMEILENKTARFSTIQRLAFNLMENSRDKNKIEDNKHSRKTIQLINCINREMRVLGPNLWAVFNGVTMYTSNYLKGNPGFGIVNGEGERMNRVAKQFLLNM